MASNFQIQRPCVLAALPRPLDSSTGQYVVGQVSGNIPSSGKRKRRRPEVVVGIDGEAANIYNVSSARLVTSYPVPPSASFTCSPSSNRQRSPETRNVTRRTYVATREPANKITLFKDVVVASGKTVSSTATRELDSAASVIHLAPTGASQRSVIAVSRDGQIACLDAETLDLQWRSSPAILHQDLAVPSQSGFSIEFCMSVPMDEMLAGFCKCNRDLLAAMPQNALPSEAETEALLLVTSIGVGAEQIKYFHVVGLLSPAQISSQLRPGVVQLHAAPVNSLVKNLIQPPVYHVDLLSATLMELHGGMLCIYDVASSVPKLQQTMQLKGATSFLQLSSMSILASTPGQLNIYNPYYRSLQSTMSIDTGEHSYPSSDHAMGPHQCQLAAYFPRLELAVAVHRSKLVAIQLEAPKARSKKRRAEGLLVDSIGRGVRQENQRATTRPKVTHSSVFQNYLPGSVYGDYWNSWIADVKKADQLLKANDFGSFERLLASKFGLDIASHLLPNGISHNRGAQDDAKRLRGWVWPKLRSQYPRKDKRWVIYAISKVFDWNIGHDGHHDTLPHLVCRLPDSNVVNYLVDAGHLSLSNLRSAFRDKLRDASVEDSALAEELVSRLAFVDPSMELLAAWISATNLGSIELLIAVRALMRSLELVQDAQEAPPKLLTNGPTAEVDAEGGDFGMELDNLEQDINKFEAYVQGNLGVRGRGISDAFSKLGNCPAASMISALHSIFRPEEVLSLVYLLRVELVKGGWTARYLDDADFERDPNFDAPPDSIIRLIAELLGRCVDAMGPSGWLLNNSIFAGDDTSDFVLGLKLEVSAALEGLNEAVYLRGIVGEAVKYGEAVERTSSSRAKARDSTKPITVHIKELGDGALPVGLTPRDGKIESTKTVSGGEIVERSARETGHLKSQQVGPYSLERIAV